MPFHVTKLWSPFVCTMIPPCFFPECFQRPIDAPMVLTMTTLSRTIPVSNWAQSFFLSLYEFTLLHTRKLSCVTPLHLITATLDIHAGQPLLQPWNEHIEKKRCALLFWSQPTIWEFSHNKQLPFNSPHILWWDYIGVLLSNLVKIGV